MPEPRNRLGQAVAFERGEQFLHGAGWVAETLQLPLDGGTDSTGSEVKQAEQEIVRVLGFDIITGQRCRWKVREVVGVGYRMLAS